MRSLKIMWGRTLFTRALIAMFAIAVGSADGIIAQKRTKPLEYDYYALALSSVLDSAAEAKKAPELVDRVRLLVCVAKTLPSSHADEAKNLLEFALRDIRETTSSEGATWAQKNTAVNLRAEVLSLYSTLDPARALLLQKDDQISQSVDRKSTATKSSQHWYGLFRNSRTAADQCVNLAGGLIDTQPNKVAVLVSQSLQEGIVSGLLFNLIEKAKESRNDGLKNEIENAIATALAGNATADPLSLSNAAVLMRADDDIPFTARNAFAEFLLRSLQSSLNVAREHQSVPWVDEDYLSNLFTAYSLTVRPAMVACAPTGLVTFDFLLEQLAVFVPDKTKSLLQSITKPEAFAEPRDRLADILKETNATARDMRLLRAIVEFLRRISNGSWSGVELTADAVSNVSDSALKNVLADALTVVRIDLFTKERDFSAATRLVPSIGSAQTRAWASLALSIASPDKDPQLKFELTDSALKALEVLSPGPKKTELALLAAASQMERDHERAFQILATAASYANALPAQVNVSQNDLGRAINWEATIGQMKTKLGADPESMSDLEINPALGALGSVDWFRANQIADTIKSPWLRIQLKLRFARAVLQSNRKTKTGD